MQCKNERLWHLLLPHDNTKLASTLGLHYMQHVTYTNAHIIALSL